MKSTRQQRNWISRMRLAVNCTASAIVMLALFGAIAATSAQAQTFSTLHSFIGTDGYSL